MTTTQPTNESKTMKITGKANRINLTVNGKRCGITISAGPWVAGVNPDTIKIRPKKYSFPSEITEALKIENNSDSITDYFEKDCIRLLPGHPLYDMAKAIA
jgi:hypothetical protein